MSAVSAQIAELAAMSQAQLRAAWRRWHKGQIMPAGLGRDLASRAIAWAMQERVYGGIPPATLRELHTFARQLAQDGDLTSAKEVRLKPGTRLIRQWRGDTYQVLVSDDGFLFQDRLYRSLTPIVKEITGAAWSGPRFFGLKDTKGAG